jgi:hypothetical protein
VKYSKLSWKKISVGLVQVNWGRKKKKKTPRYQIVSYQACQRWADKKASIPT